MHAHFILYVADQRASAKFYSDVLRLPASLDVPGMTEFPLCGGSVLGLMPRAGIRKLLGDRLAGSEVGPDTAKAELYLVVDDARVYHARALSSGAVELSPPSRRDWGPTVAYSLDRDGHVLAFAQAPDGGE